MRAGKTGKPQPLRYWVSHPKFTGMVECSESGTITLAPPVWKRFTGQRIGSLVKWLKSLGEGLRMEEL